MVQFTRNVSFLVAMLTASAHAGPVSEMYVTDGQTIWVLQGSSINRQWQVHHGPQETGIAVRNTVRTIGAHPNIDPLGAEYTLGGTWTGITYSQPVAPPPLLGEILDGTTDGQFNYGWDQAAGVLFRYDLNWANPTIEFNHGLADGFRIGVTYDPTNDSFWTSGLALGAGIGTDGTLIENWSRSGTLLSSFSTGHTSNAALALDPADQTLWIYSRLLSGTSFEQYSKSGTLLSTETYPALGTPKIVGGEFRHVVPEPSSWALAFICVAVSGITAHRAQWQHGV